MTLTMKWWMQVSSVVMALVFLSSALSPAALAQSKHAAKEEADPDEPVIHDHLLTMDKVHKYAEVAKKIEAASKADPALAAEMQKVTDTDVYNVQKAALAEKSPHLAAFLKSNGITARDFIFTPMVTFTAALAIAAEDAKGKPPAFVNPANIKFVREHKGELEKLNLFGPGADKE